MTTINNPPNSVEYLTNHVTHPFRPNVCPVYRLFFPPWKISRRPDYKRVIFFFFSPRKRSVSAFVHARHDLLSLLIFFYKRPRTIVYNACPPEIRTMDRTIVRHRVQFLVKLCVPRTICYVLFFLIIYR